MSYEPKRIMITAHTKQIEWDEANHMWTRIYVDSAGVEHRQYSRDGLNYCGEPQHMPPPRRDYCPFHGTIDYTPVCRQCQEQGAFSPVVPKSDLRKQLEMVIGRYVSRQNAAEVIAEAVEEEINRVAVPEWRGWHD